MKSWMSFFLPEDEYKERRMLQFYAEGGLVLFTALVVMFIVNQFIAIDLEVVFLLAIAFYLLYVAGRYTLSGMEYGDVATEKAFRKERQVILIRTIGFVVIFLMLYLAIIGFPADGSQWLELLALLLVVSVVTFITSYISLKRSYQKNKELL